MANEPLTPRDIAETNIRGARVLARLGAGQFGVVLLCSKDQVHDFALKLSRLSHTAKNEEQLLRVLSQHGSHPNILQFFDAWASKTIQVIQMEYIRGRTLLQVLMNGPFPEPLARTVFVQLCLAIKHAHQACSVVHRDLKLENIMLREDGATPVIIDWGMGALWSPSRTFSQDCGSPHYAAPEIFHRIPYSGPAVDMWSLGVILYCMVTSIFPFAGSNPTEIAFRVIRGRYPDPMCPASLAHLISRLLTLDPGDRIALSAVLDHPWCAPYFADPSPASRLVAGSDPSSATRLPSYGELLSHGTDPSLHAIHPSPSHESVYTRAVSLPDPRPSAHHTAVCPPPSPSRRRMPFLFRRPSTTLPPSLRPPPSPAPAPSSPFRSPHSSRPPSPALPPTCPPTCPHTYSQMPSCLPPYHLPYTLAPTPHPHQPPTLPDDPPAVRARNSPKFFVGSRPTLPPPTHINPDLHASSYPSLRFPVPVPSLTVLHGSSPTSSSSEHPILTDDNTRSSKRYRAQRTAISGPLSHVTLHPPPPPPHLSTRHRLPFTPSQRNKSPRKRQTRACASPIIVATRSTAGSTTAMSPASPSSHAKSVLDPSKHLFAQRTSQSGPLPPSPLSASSHTPVRSHSKSSLGQMFRQMLTLSKKSRAENLQSSSRSISLDFNPCPPNPDLS